MDAIIFMLVNLDKVVKQLDSIADPKTADKWAMECGLVVEARAKEICPRDTGELANSINTVPIGSGEVGVGTNLTYGLFVHEGTGEYAKGPASRPRGSYWIYVKTPGGEYTSYKEANSGQSKSYATLQEARQVMAILRSKGIDAFYTKGQQPQPFLTNALQEMAPTFDDILKEIIEEAL